MLHPDDLLWWIGVQHLFPVIIQPYKTCMQVSVSEVSACDSCRSLSNTNIKTFGLSQLQSQVPQLQVHNAGELLLGILL